MYNRNRTLTEIEYLYIFNWSIIALQRWVSLCWTMNWISYQFSWVAQSCPTLCDLMACSTPGLPVHHQLPEFTQTHLHWIGDAIQPSHPVMSFSSCLQSFPASGSFQMSQFFPSGSQRIGVSTSTSVLPMTIHWLDLLAVQGTLKSLLQHHSSKASILLCSALFIVQLSHIYITTGKTIALTRRTFVAKVSAFEYAV